MAESGNATAKLAHEAEHLDALQRMRTLAPYYAWVHDLLQPVIGRSVLDAGCGIGNFTAQIADSVDRVFAIDLSEDNLNVIRHRFADHPHVVPMKIDLDDPPRELLDAGIETVVCLDVLEHVENDVKLLRNFFRIVRHGGTLALKVPACQWLYGSVDEASDHFRRYDRKRLIERVRSAGWRVDYCRYMNLAGVAPYYVKSRILRRKANLSRTYSPRQLAAIARIVPICRWIDRLTGPPIGQSLVLRARRDAKETC